MAAQFLFRIIRGSQFCFFHMAKGWPPCLQQAVDLQNDPNFQALDVAVVNIAFDSFEEQASSMVEYGITDVPMLIDADHAVSDA